MIAKMGLLKQIFGIHVRQVRTFYTEIPTLNHVRSQLRFSQYNEVVHHLESNYKSTFTSCNVPTEVWEEMRKSLTCLSKVNKPDGLDLSILDYCKHLKYANAGISYFNFLKNNNYNPSLICAIKCMSLYALKTSSLEEEDKRNLLDTCMYVINKYPMMPPEAVNGCIRGLCKSGKWKLGLQLLENIEKQEPRYIRPARETLLMTMFENNQLDLAFKLLEKYLALYQIPTDHIHITCLEYCVKNAQTFNETVQKIFDLWRKYNVTICLPTMHAYIEACNRFGWTATKTTIEKATCQQCNQKLSEIPLSDEEYSELSKAVIRKLVVEKSYHTSTPEEVHHFVAFIESVKPYDVVIDALNVIYFESQQKSKEFINLLTYLERKRLKVVVIGRKYLQKFQTFQKMQTKAHFYFLADNTRDDVFVIYAAVKSGIGTKIISNDFMRQHKFALDSNRINILFKRWQYSYQYRHTGSRCNPLQNDLLFNMGGTIQKNNNYWHIPYKPVSLTGKVENMLPHMWACLKVPA